MNDAPIHVEAPDAYRAFIEAKASVDPATGLSVLPALNPALFDFQGDIVSWALRRGRAAVFADCGLGKTPMQLEWARHVPGNVLILAPLAVANQTVREGEKFGIEVRNVIAFLNQSSENVGKVHADTFSQFVFSAAIESAESPIEDLFFIAISALAESVLEPLNVQLGEVLSKERGLFVRPQAAVGPYRVDFMIWQNGVAPEGIYTPVIVELDGHDFHDKDKRQRSYEKARDRHLVRAGYRVLHFTGSDVFADPFKPAHEALEMLGAFCGWGRDAYDASDPMGIGDA